MPNTTSDRVVLVTGGGTGVGRAVAQRFATEGAFVYLAGRRDHQLEETAEAITARGGRCRALPTDITVREEVDSLLRSVREQHGFLDVLVTAANVFRMGLVHEMPDEDFDLIFNTNIRGLWMVSKLAIPLMLGRTNANIIHISSSGATRTDPGVGLFEASKAAVNTLTKVMAKELATQKIRVNAIAPGPLESSFFRGNVLGEDRGGHGSHPALVASVPFGRIGTPEEVARLAVFLASPESDFISGSVTAIDGALGY